jgi:hypothetical protein
VSIVEKKPRREGGARIQHGGVSGNAVLEGRGPKGDRDRPADRSSNVLSSVFCPHPAMLALCAAHPC